MTRILDPDLIDDDGTAHWVNGAVRADPDGALGPIVRLVHEHRMPLLFTPGEARTVGLALVAAAEFAEGGIE